MTADFDICKCGDYRIHHERSGTGRCGVCYERLAPWDGCRRFRFAYPAVTGGATVSEPTRTEGQPHDRLTRICTAMTDALEAHPEHREGDRCMVFLDDRQSGGIVLHGWDSDTEAMAALLIHLQAIFRANGKSLEVIAIPDDASGLT